jgi:zinc transport system substrate-binding protein
MPIRFNHILIITGILLSLPLVAAPLRVGVSVLPLESIVADIGGPEVEVRSLQQEGDSCSVFEPRPSSIAWLAKADLFFRTGVGYESVIMDKIERQFPGTRMVDLREAITPIRAVAHAHDHGHAHHDHGHACASCAADTMEAVDPHIWLDPRRLVQISGMVEKQLTEALPESGADISRRAQAFRDKAMALDARLEELLAPYAGRAFFIYHPALGYFADRYGLEQVAISPSGQAPTAKELHQRIRQARELGVRVIFIQPQENRRHAEIVAQAIGAELVEIDPMAVDWESNLLKIGEALSRAFQMDS